MHLYTPISIQYVCRYIYACLCTWLSLIINLATSVLACAMHRSTSAMATPSDVSGWRVGAVSGVSFHRGKKS
jgi:hypothetical protein